MLRYRFETFYFFLTFTGWFKINLVIFVLDGSLLLGHTVCTKFIGKKDRWYKFQYYSGVL